MADMSKYGNKYTCYSCGAKFYDLNRPVAICPKCASDQANAPKVVAPRPKKVSTPRPPVEEDPEFEVDVDDDAGGLDADEFPTLDDTGDLDDDAGDDVSVSFGD